MHDPIRDPQAHNGHTTSHAEPEQLRWQDEGRSVDRDRMQRVRRWSELFRFEAGAGL